MQSCQRGNGRPKPFRLLDLPPKILLRIIPLIDIFELALATRKTRRVLKSLKIPVDHFIIQHLEGKHGFSFGIEGGTVVSWYFVDVPQVKDPKDFMSFFSIEGIDFPTRTKNQKECFDHCNGYDNVSIYNSSKHKSGYRPFRETFNVADITKRSKGQQYHNVRYTPITMSGAALPKCWTPNVPDDYQTCLDCFIRFVEVVFKCGVTGYHMDIKSVPNFGKFFTKNVIKNSCRTFELSGVRPQEDSPLTMEAYDIDWVLTNTPINTKLTINCDRIAGNFKLEVPLMQKAITFNCVMKFFAYENLAQSQCNQLEIGSGSQLREIDYREFIATWLDGNNREFRYLDSRIGAKHAEHLKKTLFDAFKTEKCDMKRRMDNYEPTPLHILSDWYDGTVYPNARDIHRRDGMTATIVVHNECFIFVVWHKKSHKH